MKSDFWLTFFDIVFFLIQFYKSLLLLLIADKYFDQLFIHMVSTLSKVKTRTTRTGINLAEILQILLFQTFMISPYFSLAAELKMFVKKLPYWIEIALEDSPEHLLNKKIEGRLIDY